MCVCARMRLHTHILGLKKFLAALVAVGVGHHLWVDTGMVSAGQDGHRHTGVKCALQLVGDLRDLLMCPRAKENLGNLLFSVFVL